MKKLSLMTLLLLTACANDPRGGSILGGAIGAGTGAAVGYEMGGRSGSILGGAIGGAAGAAVGHDQSRTRQQRQPARGDGEYRDVRREGDGRGSRGEYRNDRIAPPPVERLGRVERPGSVEGMDRPEKMDRGQPIERFDRGDQGGYRNNQKDRGDRGERD